MSTICTVIDFEPVSLGVSDDFGVGWDAHFSDLEDGICAKETAAGGAAFRARRLESSGAGAGMDGGGLSPFASLSTALASSLGVGNIVGMGTAVALGGPGAVFWCWITGFFGIATTYGEALLSLKFRVRGRDERLVGGPMYVLEYRLHRKVAAIFFAVCGALASFGIGCAIQVHAIADMLPLPIFTGLTVGFSPAS
ncbi:MAG: alanine:cation symporter family protein [Eubacteriales bacterium]